MIFTLPGVEAKEAQLPDPHWRADRCADCHTMTNGKALPIPVQKTDEICLGCHDGKKAALEAHPIHKIFDERTYRKPPGWPLVNERLVCLTCHNINLTAGHSHPQPLFNRSFLRGGPVREMEEFCMNCHKPAFNKKLNPHLMLNPDRSIRKEACLTCHVKVPDRTARTPTTQPYLKAIPLVLCRSCHPYHIDYFEPGHIGLVMPPAMRAHTPPQIVLSLTGRIICATCHNPHPRGLFPPGSALDWNAMQIVGSDKVLSPVRSREFCLQCHNLKLEIK